MLSYGIWMLCSALVSALFFGFLSRHEAHGTKLTVLSLILAAILCPAGSKLFYMITEIRFAVSDGLMATILDLSPAKWAFMGGLIGVCGAVALASRFSDVHTAEALDAFAPAGLLMAALARFGCFFLQSDMTGWGRYLDSGWYSFFPLCIVNSWGESYPAVFMLEALCALAVLAFSLTVFKRQRFLRSLFYLCLTQIFCESLHDYSLCWLFVRIEQLFSMILIEIVLILDVIHTPKGVRGGRLLPIWISLGCTALFVGIEFALDKSSWPILLLYAVMAAGLAVLGWAEHLAYSRAEY